ncbi:hypothetical protein HYPBUDRAFT_148045 [Hyphopichia burtonii NRRL Y-1933]|uniref:Uncharacterized protein n=1 Tax=Hyphopichia burtonii NRRL Y-1933 TaxID=984485 RepID=A0A1E4RKX0_9ASCO|nr:hypothetical protein HYPBUDRAFT_148045 [Hyphopichia burtonii NRRL Y-1933]ODV67735.1 hypothetical protein HYPBUDRAFT_148045 [Hyphopichia burtonii NRRL Y-1933]
MIPGIFRDKKPVNKSEWETIRGEVKERQLQIENDLFAHTKQVSNLLAEELSKVNKVNKEEVAEITQKYVDQVRQQIKKDVEIHTGIDSQFIHYFDDKLEIIMAYNNSIAHFTGLIDQNLETIRNLHEACDQLHEQASSSTASCSDYPKEIQESLEKVMFHDKSIRIENFKTVFTI